MFVLPGASLNTSENSVTTFFNLEHCSSLELLKPANGEWSASVVIVKKKDGSRRLCVYYRRLNQVSQMDAYLMPRVDDIIDRLGKAKYISIDDKPD